MTNKYLILFILVSFSVQSYGGGKNILLDRAFWKGQPTLEEVKQKIKEGHSPTEMTRFNFDATGYAILENLPLETIQYLLAQGNDVNKLTHDGRTYFMWAAYKGNLRLMKYLVGQGAKTNIVDQHGYTTFMFAASTGQENKGVYEYCVNELGVDVLAERDRHGRNALLAYASRTTNLELVPYFIGKGLDVHSKDDHGNGIFHYIVQTGNRDFVERIVKEYQVDTKLNKATNENAILFATRRSSRSGESTLEFYRYLEDTYKLDPAIVSVKGNTALHNLVTRTKSLEVFEYFVSKGVDANQLDDKGNTALMYAASRGKKELVEFLSAKTTDVNVTNKEGHSALTRAIRSNSSDIAKLLVENGADFAVIDKKGYDLGYHLVDAYAGELEPFTAKMDYLVSLGYSIKSVQGDGATLLHGAIKQKDVALLAYLVTAGIDINAKDESGQTVLHYAAMQAKDEEMLKYLVEAGADRKITTEFDESAYELASNNELLLEKDLDFLKTGGE